MSDTMRGGLLALCIFAGSLLASARAPAGNDDTSSPSGAWHGGYFPNVVLTDQDGRRHRFYYDLIKDKVVAINFIYTKCTAICPAETAQLRQVEAFLEDRLGRDVFMYSISIDPAHDTPAVLKRYRHLFGIGEGWRFLTGKIADVELLQKRLGLSILDPAKPNDHATSVMFGNERTAIWFKRSPYDEPRVLAGLLTNRLQEHQADATERASYDKAELYKDRTNAETLFRSRCQSCHTIGGGDRLGPDLANVAKARAREWLVRWLKEPDKMLAEGDPIALKLRARYRNLPMPNFNLDDAQANSLIDYLTSRDDALKATPTGP